MFSGRIKNSFLFLNKRKIYKVIPGISQELSFVKFEY